jgi:hypothetical protein
MLPLRAILAIDAATCLAMGALLLAAATPIAALTGLPPGLLFHAGAVLLPIAAFIGILAALTMPPRAAIALVVVGNAAWVLASLLLPLSGLVRPNAIGIAFLAGQAFVVAVLAKLEADAIRLPVFRAGQPSSR